MRLRPHKLKANISNERPRHIIFFDVETKGRPGSRGKEYQDFRYGEALYWRRGEGDREDTLERFQIWELADFWAWVVSKHHKKKRLILCSHNLNVDMVVTRCYEFLPVLGYTQRSFYVKGMTTIIRFRGDRGTILFLDNANWWKVSVEALGEMVGFPKLPVDPTNASPDALIPYCERDVRILYETWKRWLEFLDIHDLGNFGITVSSQALKSYTHRFMPYPIYVHAIDEVIDLERASYHGGRVEPFWIGRWEGETRYKLDVNSMYPYVMRENLYPTKLITRWWRPSKVRIHKALSNFLIVAECELETDIPCYCMIGERGAYYPVGQFSTTLTTPEVRFALKNGHLKGVGWVAVYQREYIFPEYVDYFYGLKQQYEREGNRPYRTMAKYMLNTLYGKFGQRGLTDKLLGECDPKLCRIDPYIHAQTGERGYLIYAGGQVIRRIEGKLGFNSFVAIASHVTAYARMYLWDLIVKAGRENVFYCDTDSLVVSCAGYTALSRFLDKEALGGLKVETEASEGYIYGKKDYRLGGRRVLKGIPKKAVQVDSTTFHFDMWPSMRGLLREGNLTQYYIQSAVRKLKREVTWGWEGQRGRIYPHHLPGPFFKEERDDEVLTEAEVTRAILQDMVLGLLLSREFPQTLLFTCWDYREGELRKGVDSPYSGRRFKGVPLDKVSQEYGYTDYQAFLEAIVAQVRLNDRIRHIRSQIRSLD